MRQAWDTGKLLTELRLEATAINSVFQTNTEDISVLPDL